MLLDFWWWHLKFSSIIKWKVSLIFRGEPWLTKVPLVVVVVVAAQNSVFNTFVDDIFAWIIDMPTVHRIATLRDDLIFFIYLYQRWIYPVDLSRPNEYGFAYEGEGREKDGKEEKTKIE